jgi:hypothetical protein
MPYVNHCSFHILDAEWGHVTIKISGHRPFPHPSHLERSRVGGLPGAQGGNQLYQGRKLFYSYLRRRRLGENRRHHVRATGYIGAVLWALAGEVSGDRFPFDEHSGPFMTALSCVDQCFIADETLEQLPAPSQVGKTKVGGIDFNKPRMRWVSEAVLALSPSPDGFTVSESAHQVRTVSRQSELQYANCKPAK